MTCQGLLLACLLASVQVQAADLYRCPVKDGPPVYSDRPCGKGGEVVGKLPEASRSAAVDDGDDVNVHVEVNNHIEGSGPEARDERAEESRGLPFEVYRRLDRGMSEGEVLAIAGQPERETVDSDDTYGGVRTKSYYYVSNGRNANVTRIRFRNGTVTHIERNLAPY
jgi:hypothetical protein